LIKKRKGKKWKNWDQAKKNFQKNKKTIKNRKRTVKNITINNKVIIIGAGPSTKKYINELKKCNLDNITVICCDIILPFLDKHNIKVDYVFTVEYKKVKFFFKNVDTSKYTLCAYAGANSENIKKWKGKYCFFDILSDDKVYVSENLERYLAGTNVFNTALSVVKKENPESKVFMLGNDLYYENKLYPCDKEDKISKIKKNNPNIFIKYMNKNTTKQYLKAFLWLKQAYLLKIYKSIFVPCTGLEHIFPVISISRFCND
jgi:hypothetical protein